MSNTLLLRLAGPMQSFGTAGSVVLRPTAAIPTFTAVTGLIAAAFGVDRSDWRNPTRGSTADRIRHAELHCRIDSTGIVESDYHTVNKATPAASLARLRAFTMYGTPVKASSAGAFSATDAAGFVSTNGDASIRTDGEAVLTEREYLAGAEFLITVEHDDEDFLTLMSHRVLEPTFMTYLGRKAYAPSFPFHLGLREGTWRDVLGALPTRSRVENAKAHRSVHKITEFNPREVAVVEVPTTTDPLSSPSWKAGIR